jgi:hypothetical protein
MFNIDKKFPGMEVTHLWGETEEFARKSAESGKIPNIIKDQKEMLGKIGALNRRSPSCQVSPGSSNTIY